MPRYLLLLIAVFYYSCTNAQTDKIVFTDTLFRFSIYQSELDNYVKLRGIADTIGNTKNYIKIIRSAKMMNGSVLIDKDGKRTALSYEDALKRAEEVAKLRSLVDKVLVVKHERKMYLLKKGQVVKTFPVALGPNPVGQKEYEGDGKTPEGTYTLDWQRWETSVFHSFHISYPNKIDSARAKVKGLTPGSNIMVHGTSKGTKKKKDWTNGCIALTNTDMVAFRKIVFQDTPIEIKK